MKKFLLAGLSVLALSACAGTSGSLNGPMDQNAWCDASRGGNNWSYHNHQYPCPSPGHAAGPTVRLDTQYTVFFPYNSTALSDSAQAALARAAYAYRNLLPVRVDVTGHTDRSGSASANMVLSMKRADVVRQALIAQGVPAQVITAVGYGEMLNRIPTRDGVREPENRRAEIFLVVR